MNEDKTQVNITDKSVDTGDGSDLRMSGQNFTDMYNQLATNLQSAQNAQLNTIGADAAAKGSYLSAPVQTQGVSQYDYNRWVGPQIQATADELVATGEQLGAQQNLKNMLADAQANYENAQKAAQARAYARALTSAKNKGGSTTGSGENSGENTASSTVKGVQTNVTDVNTSTNPDTAGEKRNITFENGNQVGWAYSYGPDGKGFCYPMTTVKSLKDSKTTLQEAASKNNKLKKQNTLLKKQNTLGS